jgi:hypothetical protein
MHGDFDLEISGLRFICFGRYAKILVNINVYKNVVVYVVSRIVIIIGKPTGMLSSGQCRCSS